MLMMPIPNFYGYYAWTIHKIREGKVWKKLRT